MNEREAAQILATLHGAYPNVKIDEAMVSVWKNSLAVTDFDSALEAAGEWISVQRFWPTLAEFNAVITSIRKQDVATGRVALPGPPRGTPSCDGTGWIALEDGLHPCQHCNPWSHDLVSNGDWQNLRQRPPQGWMQPMPCKPARVESELFSWSEAHEAIERGYREHHDEHGTDPAVVDRKVRDVLRRGLNVG